MNEHFISKHLKERVNRELEPGEHVEWLGKPIPRYFTRIARSVYVFGIPWTAFAIFWTIGYVRQEGHGSAVLPGLPFILIGLVVLATPIWCYRRALKTVYVITNKRAITIQEGWSCSTQSYYSDNLQDIYSKEQKDGTGDVIITCQALRDSWIARYSEPLGFLHIKNPKEIEKKLKKLAEQSAEADVE
jgi:hypothetical protein